MALKNPLIVRTLAWGFARLLRTWMSTTRLHLDAHDVALDPRQGARGNIYCMWHEDMLFLGNLFANTPCDVLVSRSRDGEYISQVLKNLGLGTVRGSSNKGGANAVLQIVRSLQGKNCTITPDGPRGPRRVFQPGAPYLASRSGMPMIPVVVAYDRAWRLKSWDKMAIPKLFSKVVVSSGPPIYVPAEATAEELEQYRLQVQTAMQQQNTRAEDLVTRWRAGKDLKTVPAQSKTQKTSEKKAA